MMKAAESAAIIPIPIGVSVTSSGMYSVISSMEMMAEGVAGACWGISLFPGPMYRSE